MKKYHTSVIMTLLATVFFICIAVIPSIIKLIPELFRLDIIRGFK